MTMSLTSFNQLKKLMARTTSDSDNEALSSIRHANRLLEANGITWDHVFRRVVTVVHPVDGSTIDQATLRDDDGLDALFERAIDNAEGGFRDTLLSIRSQYERTGRLSPKQRAVVEGAASR